MGGDQLAASKLLQEAGIPGTKHLDGASRYLEGDQTYNLVPFESENVRIRSRDGELAYTPLEEGFFDEPTGPGFVPNELRGDDTWFHGTVEPDIEEFNENTFFTRNPEEAQSYADQAYSYQDNTKLPTIYPVNLRGNKIFDIDNDDDYEFLRSLDPYVADSARANDGMYDYLEPVLTGATQQTARTRQALIDAGYDGAFMREDWKYDDDELEKSLMMFKPSESAKWRFFNEPGKGADLEEALTMPETGPTWTPESQGYTQDAYHGSTHDITEFDAEQGFAGGDWGKSVYTTTSADDVNANYAGEGPDLTSRIESEAELIVDQAEWEPDTLADYGYTREQFDADPDGVARAIAKERLVGDASEGVVYPLKINTEKYAVMGGPDSTKMEGPDYYAQAKDDIDRLDYESDEDYEEAIFIEASERSFDDPDSLYVKIHDALMYSDAAEDPTAISEVMEGLIDDIHDNQVDIQDLNNLIRDKMAYIVSDEPDMSAGGVAAQVFKNLGYEGVIDNTVNDKFGRGRLYGAGMEGMDADTQHIITFPGAENTIRSTQARFDPSKRTSKNILASHPAAGLIAAGGGAALAESLLGGNEGVQ
jgi:hypothetical protein